MIATKGGLVRPSARALGRGRQARAPASGDRRQPEAPEARAHRPLPAARARSEGAARGLGRRARRRAARGQDPPHRRRPTSTSRQLEQARKVVNVVSVQNEYNLGEPRVRARARSTARSSASRSCRGIRWAPAPRCGPPGSRRWRRSSSATPAQVAIAWLLAQVAGDAADPGHRLDRAPRGERALRRSSSFPRKTLPR